jgi:hypothetical protein
MTDPKETPPVAGNHPVEVPEELNAVYSNLVRISHSPSDIVFDFGQLLPLQKPRVLERVVMSPIGAKLFFNALKENLTRYEAMYGEIKLPGDSTLANDLFKQVRPPEPPKE